MKSDKRLAEALESAVESGRVVVGRRERRKLQTRQSLADAAEQLFSTRGMDAVSVDEIAELADVGKGTFYNYFADKDSLAMELYVAGRRKLDEHIAEINEGVTDPFARIARALCFAQTYVLTNRAQVLTTFRLHSVIADPDSPLNAALMVDVRQALKDPRCKVTSTRSALVFVDSVFHGASRRAAELNEPRAVAQVTLEMGHMLLMGLGVPAAEARRIITSASADSATGR